MARGRLIDTLSPLAPASQPLLAALDQVAAQDITAPIDLPAFTNSAMDGIALRSTQVAHASPTNPVRLRIAGFIEAGAAWFQPLGPDETLRIGTGAAVPNDCDAVIPAEEIAEGHGFVEIRAPVPPGRNLRPQGEDVRRGHLVVRKGDQLRPQEIGLLAALGIESIDVIPRPSVTIISTGPELLEAAAPAPVPDANGPMLAALARAAGAHISSVQKSPGSIGHLRDLIEDHSRSSNLIVSSGGISNSPSDSVARLVETLPGGELWEVRLRPGKHFGLARVAGATLVALPGNPVAAFVGFELLARAAIERLAGREFDLNHSMAILSESVASAIGRTDALRGHARVDETGQLTVRPTGNRGSGVVSSLVEANCLIIVPETVDTLAPGAVVQIRWIPDR